MVSSPGKAAATRTLLAYEGFQYNSNTPVIGQSGGTGWSGAWFKHYGVGGNPTNATPGLTYGGLTNAGSRMRWGSGGNTINGVGRDLPLIDSGLVYLQFIGNFSSQSLGGGTPNLRLFKPDGSTSGGIGNNGGPYLAILDSSLSTSATSQTSVSGKSQALMVVRINYHDVRTEMWVNPDLSTFDYANPPLPNATYTGLAPEFSRLAPYIKSPSSVDEISIYRMSTPQVTTNAGSDVTAGAATLNATVDDNGDAVAVSFDYGTSSAYGNNVSAAEGGYVAQGAGNTASSVSLAGLTCGSTYHYRVQANYTAGTAIHVKGADQSFITPPCAPSILSVQAGDAGATVGFAPPGANGDAPILSYTVTANPGGMSATAGTSPITLTGLTNGVAYTFTATAQNAGGSSDSSAPSTAVTPAHVPAVIGVTVPTNGRYRAGATLNFTVRWDDAIMSSGTPRLALVIGSSPVYATYSRSPTPESATFSYVILNGQEDLDGVTVGALSLSAASIRSTVGADVALTLNNVASTSHVLVDAVAPLLTGVGVSSTTTTGGVLEATSSEQARAYWMALPQGATAPSSAQLHAGVAYSGVHVASAGNAAMAAGTPVQFTATGLTEGHSYQFYLMAEDTALNRSTVVSAAFSTQGIAGACGTAHGSTLLAMPATPQQCSAGTASSITSTSQDWQWSCAGSLGTASCSTAKPRTATGSGAASVAVANTSGWVLDEANSAGFIPVTGHPQSPNTSPPAGVSFPHGLMEFRLTAGTPNSTASVTISYPSPLPAGTIYWKYGPEPGNTQSHWYAFRGATISPDRRSITLTILDGGLGDSDLATPSSIVDPGGPGVADPRAIPTLSSWQMALLITLLAVAGARLARTTARIG